MIKTIFWIWPHHHVGLVGDHPEAQLIKLLHQLQQLVVLPAIKKDLIAFISYIAKITLDLICCLPRVILWQSD